ncbi:hypothetical protein, partial [Burkholderia multivorans]|uniref:hypothetical protein n=1 Tax=Burkholderia multivorans TaxID=87883 RepID=UPI0019553329
PKRLITIAEIRICCVKTENVDCFIGDFRGCLMLYFLPTGQLMFTAVRRTEDRAALRGQLMLDSAGIQAINDSLFAAYR